MAVAGYTRATPLRRSLLRGYVMFSCSVLFLAVLASAQGRAVNISNTWVLPEEGFPVFYRYFRDRISWYEADAVCQFHHANLVTVDTTAQYDAVRAYLKELDITSAVWVGLIRSNPDGDFTWTDYRGLSGDGYWSSAPDARAAPLCAAADPVSDYRWEARACGGPTVASFICELPVPQWALGNEGCMVRELPALTILYLPESAAVQLTADCGLAGVKRVQCTGDVKRENLLKDLSCVEEEDLSTTSVSSYGTLWNSTTDGNLNITDENLTETTTEDETTTERETEGTTHTTQTTPAPYVPLIKLPIKVNKLSNLYSQKNVKLDLTNNNNQNNDIPKFVSNNNLMSLEQTEKLEDEKYMHHKMLHDELARHGNFETIFTQPTDHFVPPLVMAKAKISDDMTVLSLAEKHAQQLAEQHLAKHVERNNHVRIENSNMTPKLPTKVPEEVEIIDKPLVTKEQVIKVKEINESSKDKSKYGMPKKYKEKYEDPKSKNFKIDNKLYKLEKGELSTPGLKVLESTNGQKIVIPEEDTSIEMKVIIKETSTVSSNVSPKIIENTTIFNNESDGKIQSPVISKNTTEYLNQTGPIMESETISTSGQDHQNVLNVRKTSEVIAIETATTEKPTTENVKTEAITMKHEVIKITLINDNLSTRPTETVYEITTRLPEIMKTTTEIAENTNISHFNDNSSNFSTANIFDNKTNFNLLNSSAPQQTTVEENLTSTTLSTKVEIISTLAPVTTEINKAFEIDNSTVQATTILNTQHSTFKDINNAVTGTDVVDDDVETNSTESLQTIDDAGSPLLSGANEPLHRPNRSRRPQPPSRLNKFNPFRILG